MCVLTVENQKEQNDRLNQKIVWHCVEVAGKEEQAGHNNDVEQFWWC